MGDGYMVELNGDRIEARIDLRQLNDDIRWLTQRIEDYMEDNKPGGTVTKGTKVTYVPPRLALMVEDKLLEQLKDLGFHDPLPEFMEACRGDLAPLEWVSGGSYSFDWELEDGRFFNWEVTHVGVGWFAHVPFPLEPIPEPEPEVEATAEFLEVFAGIEEQCQPEQAPPGQAYWYYNEYDSKVELNEANEEKKATLAK